MSETMRTTGLSGPFAVETAGLVKRYGSAVALDGVELRVPEQAVYVLVGANGAGKSTLLRSLMNVVRPDAGVVRVHGIEARTRGADVRSHIGYVPETQEAGPGWLPVARLLAHYARYFPTWDADYAERLVKVLSIRTERKLRTLSKGERRRVQLVVALAHRPSLLLLDEPTDGLDHVARERVLEILTHHLSDSPTTVLVSTHRIYEVERLVDHVGVLDRGTLLEQSTREDLQARLRRYRADVPDGWKPPTDRLDVLRRAALGRSIDWTVRGRESDVVAALTQSGATMREVSSLPLDDAATAMLLARSAS